MTNKTTPAATGGVLDKLWRERVAALLKATTIALTRSTTSSGRHGRPTPPGSRFSSVLYKMDVEGSPDDCAMMQHVLARLEAMAGREA